MAASSHAISTTVASHRSRRTFPVFPVPRFPSRCRIVGTTGNHFAGNGQIVNLARRCYQHLACRFWASHMSSPSRNVVKEAIKESSPFALDAKRTQGRMRWDRVSAPHSAARDKLHWLLHSGQAGSATQPVRNGRPLPLAAQVRPHLSRAAVLVSPGCRPSLPAKAS